MERYILVDKSEGTTVDTFETLSEAQRYAEEEGPEYYYIVDAEDREPSGVSTRYSFIATEGRWHKDKKGSLSSTRVGSWHREAQK